MTQVGVVPPPRTLDDALRDHGPPSAYRVRAGPGVTGGTR